MPSLPSGFPSQIQIVGKFTTTPGETPPITGSTPEQPGFDPDLFKVLHSNYTTATRLLEAESLWGLHEVPQDLARSVPITLAKSVVATGKDVVGELLNGQSTFAQAGGKLLSEVSTSVITSSVTTLANKAVVSGLTRLQASLPISLLAGMSVGVFVHQATTIGLENSGWKQFLIETLS